MYFLHMNRFVIHASKNKNKVISKNIKINFFYKYK